MTELELHRSEAISVEVPDGTAEHLESQRIIRERALWCAGVSLEPVPFLDLAVILPLHIKMVLDIGQIHGFQINRERAKEIALELASTVALNYATRLASRSALKAIPLIGAALNAPMVYASTFALGTVAERYFRARRPELPLLSQKIELTQSLLEQGKTLAKTMDWREILRMLERFKNSK